MVIYSGKGKLDYIFLGISDVYNLIKIRYLFVVFFLHIQSRLCIAKK